MSKVEKPVGRAIARHETVSCVLDRTDLQPDPCMGKEAVNAQADQVLGHSCHMQASSCHTVHLLVLLFSTALGSAFSVFLLALCLNSSCYCITLTLPAPQLPYTASVVAPLSRCSRKEAVPLASGLKPAGRMQTGKDDSIATGRRQLMHGEQMSASSWTTWITPHLSTQLCQSLPTCILTVVVRPDNGLQPLLQHSLKSNANRIEPQSRLLPVGAYAPLVNSSHSPSASFTTGRSGLALL